MISVGQRIRNLRMEAHMNQGDLARKAEIKQSVLSDIERGRFLPSLTTALKIARALNLGLDDIFLSPDITKLLPEKVS